MQGQLLAARHNWRWISAGQLLRDTHDMAILQEISAGHLIDNNKIHGVVSEALKRAKDIEKVILDGFPRNLTQATWLVDAQPDHQPSITLAIVLEVPREELFQRLKVRGRVDDTPEVIEERLKLYRQEIYPILSYFNDNNIRIAHVDGMGSVGQVHDRIEAEIQAVLTGGL